MPITSRQRDVMEQSKNPALVASRDGADCEVPQRRNHYNRDDRQNLAGQHRPVRSPHLRINGQRLYWDRWLWSVWLRNDDGRKHLASFDNRRAAREAALSFALHLHVPVRGRWSGFYKKFRRAQAVLRQRRVARLAAKRGVS
jgi:hypothetical protein